MLLGPSLQFPPLHFIHRTLSHHMWTEAATEVRGHKLQKTCPATQLCDRPRNQRMAYIENFTLGIPNIVIVCLPRKRWYVEYDVRLIIHNKWTVYKKKKNVSSLCKIWVILLKEFFLQYINSINCLNLTEHKIWELYIYKIPNFHLPS